MPFTQKELQDILAMDDESLRELILTITKAAGGSVAKAAALTSDIPSLKKLMSRLTPAEAEALLSKAGKGKSEDIYRIIKNSRK